MAPDDLDVFASLGSHDEPKKRRKRGRKSRRRRRIIGWIAVGVVVALIATIGVIAFRLLSSSNDVEAIPDAFPEETTRPEPFDGEGNAPINYLLIGVDGDEETDGSLLTSLGDRADTIMVVHIPPDRESIQIMSIMRDSWLTIPGYQTDKINAALAVGGVPLLVSTVESLIDQRIDDVAIIDFEGFRGLTEALGGVTVQNEVAFTSGGYEFAEGEITLEDGDEALRFVRERHAFADSDYQRVRNQRAFLRGVLDELMTPGNLANPFRIADIIETMAPFMATTEGLSTSSMVGLATEFLRAGGVPDIQMFTLPTGGTGTEGGQSVVYVDPGGLTAVREAFAQESMNDFEPPPDRP